MLEHLRDKTLEDLTILFDVNTLVRLCETSRLVVAESILLVKQLLKIDEVGEGQYTVSLSEMLSGELEHRSEEWRFCLLLGALASEQVAGHLNDRRHNLLVEW